LEHFIALLDVLLTGIMFELALPRPASTLALAL